MLNSYPTQRGGVCKAANAVRIWCISAAQCSKWSQCPPPVNTGNGAQGADKNDVPQFQTLMLPLLKVMGGGHEMTTIQMRDAVADDLALTAEALSQRLPGGTPNTFSNRIGWAITFLFKAGLLERPHQATYVISETGKQLLLNPPLEIDAEFLRLYEEFNWFYDSPRGEYKELLPDEGVCNEPTPDEQIEIDFSQIQRELSNEVVEKIKLLSTEDFKKLVINLLEIRIGSRQNI